MSIDATIHLCFRCGASMPGGSVTVHDAYGLQHWHAHCYDQAQREAQAAAFGVIFDTWLTDGVLLSPHAARVAVAEVAAVHPLKDRVIRRKRGDTYHAVVLPTFEIVLRGGKEYGCAREFSDSLVYGPKWDDNSPLVNFCGGEPQPASSPSHVATEKFHGDLIIAWAEAIKSKRLDVQ